MAASLKAAAIVLASIYFPGDGIVGKHNYATASGQRYDAHRLACAHKELPFFERLFLRRGPFAVEVVVNDRGPYIRGRSLDCTPAVAKALHYSGVVRVTMAPWPPLPKERPHIEQIAEGE